MHTHPKVAAVASQNWPFRHDAKCEPLLKFLKANIHEASSDAYPLNLPTRVREDPKKKVNPEGHAPEGQKLWCHLDSTVGAASIAGAGTIGGRRRLGERRQARLCAGHGNAMGGPRQFCVSRHHVRTRPDRATATTPIATTAIRNSTKPNASRRIAAPISPGKASTTPMVNGPGGVNVSGQARRRQRTFHGLSRLNPCIDPAQERSYFLESCLLQMLGGNGCRCLVWACTVNDNLQFARIGHYHWIDILGRRGHGARNHSLFASLLRSHIENEKLPALVDQPAKFVDGD